MKTIKYTILLLILPLHLSYSQEDTDLKKCVAFIFSLNTKGEYQPRGTGFFVAVPTKTDSTKMYIYFVTAKHVIQNKDKSFRTSIYLRLNISKDSSEIVFVPLKDHAGLHYAVHQDTTVDLAVIMTSSFKLGKYENLLIAPWQMATKSFITQNNIREGDEVLFCGLFLNYFGRQRNYPIFRFGKVALMTDERVPFKGQLSYLYLFEANSFGGNSGSPVFFKLDSQRNRGSSSSRNLPRYALAGVMSGYYGATIDTAYTKTDASNFILFQNAGIAAIVPTYQLLEIFDDLSRGN